jgi:hypothetical protein
MLGSSIELLRLVNGFKVLVIVRKGFIEFTKEVANPRRTLEMRSEGN